MDFAAYVEGLRRLYTEAGVPLRLCPPAPESEIGAAERDLGFELEPGLRRAWIEANGSVRSCALFARPGYYTGLDFLSVAGALRQRATLAKRAPQYAAYADPKPRDHRLLPGWFQSGWLPFAEFGGGSLLLLADHSPAASGARGQIIGFVHDPDEMVYVAPTFAEFLEASLSSIERAPEEYITT
jgi:cell wall assembly regulator SMI1